MKRRGWLRKPVAASAAATLALVANLIAAGVPVLHSWAHVHAIEGAAPAFGGGVHDDRGSEHAERGHEHPHHDEEIHPVALHDEALVVPVPEGDFFGVVTAPEIGLTPRLADLGPPLHPVPPVASRAPPAADRARAPPLA